MVVIGVTGGIGTGKSTVSKMLQAHGAILIDADQITHRLMLPDGPAFSPLVEAFGTEILASDGTINRRELGRRAFADVAGTRRIEAIVHPLVISVIRARLAEIAASQEMGGHPTANDAGDAAGPGMGDARAGGRGDTGGAGVGGGRGEGGPRDPRGAPVVVIDVPLLYESGLDALCDQVWVVTADAAARRRRVAAREGAATDEVLARERWQMPMEAKIARADAVIDNSGLPEETAAQVARLWPLPPA